jgi:hypothetical protein
MNSRRGRKRWRVRLWGEGEEGLPPVFIERERGEEKAPGRGKGGRRRHHSGINSDVTSINGEREWGRGEEKWRRISGFSAERARQMGGRARGCGCLGAGVRGDARPWRRRWEGKHPRVGPAGRERGGGGEHPPRVARAVGPRLGLFGQPSG